jgi:hypothetical protein
MKERACSRNKSLQVILILFSLFVYPINTFSQDVEKRKSKEYINDLGWEIPGLEYCKKWEVIYEKNNRRVTSYILKEDLFVEPFFFLPEDKRQRSINPQDSHITRWRVREITKFQACGAIYCYKVSYNPYSIPKGDGVGGSIAAIYEVFYYDDNGDGIFERLKGGLIVETPKWICKD